MAYQFADGFDLYGNTFTLTGGYPWDSVNNSPVTTTADFRFTAPGSLPTGSCSFSGVPASGTWVRKNLSGNQTTLIAGFGVKVGAVTGNPYDVCQFYDSGNAQVSLGVLSTGALQFYRGIPSVGGTAIGTASAAGTITANTWYGFAIQVTFGSGTAGSVQLFINGNSTPAISSSGLNTSATGNAWANQAGVGTSSNQGQSVVRIDDYYCFDTTGGVNNSLLGADSRILTKMPASPAGTYTNWTVNGGLGTNFATAAQIPPNTANYNSNNTPGTKDSYNTQTATLNVAPYFVVTRASMEMDDAGPHSPSLFVRSGSTDGAGVVIPSLTSGYLFYDAVFANDPNTGMAWTGPAADAAQIGIIEG